MPPTTTAGDTAAKINPRDNPSGTLKLNNAVATNPVTIASPNPGITVNLAAAKPTLLKATKSNSKPDRIKITDNPAALVAELHSFGNASTNPPGTLRKHKPLNNIPSNGGTLMSFANVAPTCAAAHMNIKENTAPPGMTTTLFWFTFGNKTSPRTQ
jgi:hypothetical protein